MQILLGCGRDRTKKLWLGDDPSWQSLVTLDINPDVGADVVHDLCQLPLPFADDVASEIHLYDVLEHTRAQGDWRGFFAEFAEFWRILRPGGHLFAIVPRWNGQHAWTDPGHTRVLHPQTFTWLSQRIYAEQLDGAERTNRTDYRFVWKGDFDIVGVIDAGNDCDGIVLRAIKPSRLRT